MKNISEEHAVTNNHAEMPDPMVFEYFRNMIAENKSISIKERQKYCEMLYGIEQMFRIGKTTEQLRMYIWRNEVKENINKTLKCDTEETNKLCKELEEALLLNSQNQFINDFLDAYEKTMRAFMLLDYSKKIALPDSQKNKTNLLDYFSTSLELLMGKIESSTVSRKGFNALFEYVAELKGIITILTDEQGKIRFINEAGEKFFDIGYTEALGSSVKPFFEDYAPIEKRLNGKDVIKDLTVNLMLSGEPLQTKLDLIKTHAVNECEDETPEILYILRPSEHEKAEDFFAYEPESFFTYKTITASVRSIPSRIKAIAVKIHVFFFKRLKYEEKINLYNDLYALISSGADVRTAIAQLHEQTTHKVLRKILSEILDSLSQGKSLSQAMKRTGSFTPFEYLSVKIGEKADKLPVIFKDLTTRPRSRFR